jgi:hypothetical protein
LFGEGVDDFFDRWGGQRHADSVANPLGQQHSEGDGGFDGALKQRSGFGDTQVQRVVAASGQLPVCSERIL